MIPDDLAGLSTLLVVADKRSFTAAAAALQVTPSAVSQTISALERRLGVRLLQRTTRSVGLTEAGERFLSRLRPAMADVRASFEALDELRDRPAGTLRLNIPHLAGRDVIEPVLPRFLAMYPDIRVEITLDDRLVDIVAGGFDAGIRIGEMLDREMIAVRVGPDVRMAVVGSPAYFAARGKPRHPRDLLAHACINYRRITGGDVYRWEFTENDKDFEIAVDGPLVCNDSDMSVRAALAGIGIAYVFPTAVERELAEKRLVRVLEPFCTPFPGYFLYYPSRAHVPKKLAALVEFLKYPPARRRAKKGS
ncbi:MAG: LysR family transcriptional regulator [Minicystis sp.]